MKKLLLILLILTSFSPLFAIECCPTGQYAISESSVTIRTGRTPQSDFCYNQYKFIWIASSQRHEQTSVTCTVEPTCDDNQTIDTSVLPHECKDNPPPLVCPPNSHPDDNNEFCVCNSPYVLTDVNGTNVCKLPSSVPDENSTKPNGDCEVGFAKNSLGVCKEDSDGDNVPDDEDTYPDDSSRSGGDGESNPSICNLDIKECRNCSCPVGSADKGAVWLTNDGAAFTSLSCQNGNTVIYCASTNSETPDPRQNDCNKGYVPAPDWATTGNCVPEQQRCAYPPFSFVNNYPFQSITVDVFKCTDLGYRYGGGNFDTYNCPDGTVACYYHPSSDNNNSTPDNPENNNSNPVGDNNNTNPSDGNGTGTIDTTEIESKLDAINTSLGSDGAINSSLSGLSSLINSTASTNHTDLTNINGSLGSMGSKLDGIKSAIESQNSTPATDMNPTNDILKEIRDKVSEDTTVHEDKLSSDRNGFSSIVDTSLLTFSTNMESITNIINGVPLPQVSSSTGCSLQMSVFNQQIDLYPSMKKGLLFISPLLLLIWNIILTIYVIKIAFLAYRDLQFRFLELFKYS